MFWLMFGRLGVSPVSKISPKSLGTNLIWMIVCALVIIPHFGSKRESKVLKRSYKVVKEGQIIPLDR